MSGEAGREQCVACCAGQPDSEVLAPTVGGIGFGRSKVILAEGLRKACAYAQQETDRRRPAPTLPAKARATRQKGT